MILGQRCETDRGTEPVKPYFCRARRAGTWQAPGTGQWATPGSAVAAHPPRLDGIGAVGRTLDSGRAALGACKQISCLASAQSMPMKAANSLPAGRGFLGRLLSARIGGRESERGRWVSKSMKAETAGVGCGERREPHRSRKALGESRAKRGERGLWRRRFWEHLIRDQADFNRHVDYVHWNPVKHGWVRRVALASFQFPCIHAARIYPDDRGGENIPSLAAGE